jgi:phage gp45-like
MMTWSHITEYVRQALSWLVTYSRIAGSTADGNPDEIEGRSSPDEPSYQMSARRMWPFGLRSRPPAGVEAVVIHVGGSGAGGIMVGAESAKFGPSDLEDGETALYNKTAAVIRIWKDGRITIDGDNADVIVNGGGAKVARVGDKTEAHSHTVTFSLTDSLNKPVTGSITLVDASPAIAEGAEHFKA